MANGAVRLAAFAIVAGLAGGAGAARIAARPVADAAGIELQGIEPVAHGYHARIKVSGAAPPSRLMLSSREGVVCQTAAVSAPSSEILVFFPARDCSEPLRPGAAVRLTGRLNGKAFSVAATMR